MITNLTATITFALVTNWTTDSIEYPAPKEPREDGSITLEYRAIGYHKSGIIYSNTIANIHWGTNRIPVVLDSVQCGNTKKTDWK